MRTTNLAVLTESSFEVVDVCVVRAGEERAQPALQGDRVASTAACGENLAVRLDQQLVHERLGPVVVGVCKTRAQALSGY